MRNASLSRRRLLAGLGGLAATGVLAACGGGTTASPTTAPSKPAAGATTAPVAGATTAPAAGATKPAAGATTAPAAGATTAPAAAKPATGGSKAQVVIRDHDWLQPGEWYDTFIAEWEQEHPNIKIEREWIARAEMHAKLMALAATQQIGDTVRINVAPLVSEMQIKGVLHDLDSLYQTDTEWVNNDLKQFWPGNLATYTREGKLWGLPVVGHPGCVQYYLNVDMIKESGATMPPADGNWTYDDLAQVIKACTKDTNGDGRMDQYGINPCVGNEGVVGHLRAHGGDMFDREGKTCLIDTPESKAGLRALYDLWHTHNAAIPWEATLVPNELFFSRKMAINVSTSGNAAGWPAQIAKLPQPFEMQVVPPPKGPAGHPTQVSSDGKGVSKITQNPAEAWTVLSRLFTSRDHGIERFAAGLGSPGSRYDVWDSEGFRQRAPALQNIAKVMVLPPAPEMKPWHHPANGRYFEADSAANSILQRLWLGELQPDAAADQVKREVQAIMDKGPA